jgi:bifunctional non-homologous end joining protein LigD
MPGKGKKATAGNRDSKDALASRRKSPAVTVDRQLARYRSMRDFSSTSEPSGDRASATDPRTLPFVIQKHAATRLHYDFRLGWRGVLKSWAVAKGPSYVVADKRLAVQVEDHPIEYGGFEGTIPKGQYGGGTVMLWDEGSWEPLGDADEGLRTGRLKFVLHGKKLRGHWTLVRMGGKAARESKPNWLLIKEHDEFERAADAGAITKEMPDSVITGRSLETIATAEDHIWDSRSGLAAEQRRAGEKQEEGAQSTPARKADAENGSRRRAKPMPSGTLSLAQYPREALPGFIAPQLASLSPSAPESGGWVHELKLDGYRIQAQMHRGKAKLFSRNGLDWTARMPNIAHAAQQLNVQTAVLDGEVVVLDEHGVSSFAALQAAFDKEKPAALIYFCFDLLHIDGHTLRGAPLQERKAMLRALIEQADQETLRFSEDFDADGALLFREACKLGAEGIISKRADAKYVSGRSANWIKTKCIHRQEFVIGGFTPPAKGGDGLGALLLGYNEDKHLRYAGRSGTGFTQKSAHALRKRLEALKQSARPFQSIAAAASRDAIWVKPELVAEIQFSTWTSDGMLRQASFKGLREDKPAMEVKQEQANPENTPRQASDKQHDKPHQNGAANENPPGRAAIRLTHAGKVIDEVSGLTKQNLADYYDAVAEKMLPYISGRPVSIVRCPDGSTGPCFFQKHFKTGLPAGTSSVDVPDTKTGKVEAYITISTKDALVGMAQMNVLEFHPWGARNDKLESPDRLVFDLDPDESIPWEVLAESAADVRKRLKKLGLTSFLKGTGGKGLHIVAPIVAEGSHPWPLIKDFSYGFVRQMEADNPQRYLTKVTKAARKGKIYLDYLRNERGATSVAPYSPRHRVGAPVSIPFAWSVLKADAMPLYAAADFKEWLPAIKRDPWAKLRTLQQRLTENALKAVGVAL